MKSLWIKATTSLMLIAAVGVGVWAVIDKLDDTTFKVIVGVVLTLVIVVVVGVLFIGYGLVQSYIQRRLLAQDDMSDLKQMAMLSRIMGGNRPSNVNLKLPHQQGAWPTLIQGQHQQPFDGAYRDTTVNSEIEIE